MISECTDSAIAKKKYKETIDNNTGVKSLWKDRWIYLENKQAEKEAPVCIDPAITKEKYEKSIPGTKANDIWNHKWIEISREIVGKCSKSNEIDFNVLQPDIAETAYTRLREKEKREAFKKEVAECNDILVAAEKFNREYRHHTRPNNTTEARSWYDRIIELAKTGDAGSWIIDIVKNKFSYRAGYGDGPKYIPPEIRRILEILESRTKEVAYERQIESFESLSQERLEKEIGYNNECYSSGHRVIALRH